METEKQKKKNTAFYSVNQHQFQFVSDS